MSSKKRAYSKLCEQQFFLEYHYWEMRKMTTFLIGLAILIIGGFLYGSFVERIFKPDDRQTPAVKLEDGVDYVPMSKWKNALWMSSALSDHLLSYSSEMPLQMHRYQSSSNFQACSAAGFPHFPWQPAWRSRFFL